MSRNSERYFSGGETEQTSAWKIAIGVAAGILIAGLMTYGIRIYFVNQAITQVNQSIQQITTQSQRSMQELQEREASRQQQARELVDRQIREKAAQQQLAEDQRQQQMDELARKNAAWEKFYKKPALCDKAEGQAFVECANGYIRAKSEFEKQYAAGKL